MTTTPMARRLVSVLALFAAAATLVACAVGAASQDASVQTPTPGSAAPADAPPPARRPPTLLRFTSQPADAVFRSGETVRLTLVVSNAEPSPLAVADLPPAVMLVRPDGERVRTFPGGAERVTLPPGGAYRHPVVWDGRRDDGSPAPAGRYGLALSTVRVGAGTLITAGAPGFLLHPVGGVRLGELRPGLSATSEGVTMTLERLAMGEREATLEARIVPALPNRSIRGAPLGDWRFQVGYRLDGGPPEVIASPGFGVDDPARTSLTWTLDPLPATAQALDLTVDLSGEARGHWAFRVPLAAPAGGAPTPTPPPARPGAPPVPGWRPSANPGATDHGFAVVRLGAVVQTLGAPSQPGYVAAYVAFVAPPGDQAIPAPAAGQLRGADSLGQRHAVEYTEVVRLPGLTIGAVVLRGPPAGRTTLSLEIDALEVVRGPTARELVTGRWTIGLADQMVDVPQPSLVTMPGGKQVVEANGARIHYASGAGGPAPRRRLPTSCWLSTPASSAR
jgi:hypothetical protein